MSPGWQGDTLTFTGEQMMMGEKASAKDTFTKKGANEFTHEFEMTMKAKRTRSSTRPARRRLRRSSRVLSGAPEHGAPET
jgi:hypothetical protein